MPILLSEGVLYIGIIGDFRAIVWNGLSNII
nr:MAG TPA: protein of unknown function (DUF4941) [Inoviridae sp.]